MLTRLVGLEPRRRHLLMRAAFWLVTFRAGIRLLPFKTVRRLATPAVLVGSSKGPCLESVTWAVAAAARRLPGTTCLPRALALNFMLRRAGFASTLQIGVAREADEALGAHAWVTCEGRPVGGSDLGRYTPFA